MTRKKTAAAASNPRKTDSPVLPRAPFVAIPHPGPMSIMAYDIPNKQLVVMVDGLLVEVPDGNIASIKQPLVVGEISGGGYLVAIPIASTGAILATLDKSGATKSVAYFAGLVARDLPGNMASIQ